MVSFRSLPVFVRCPVAAGVMLTLAAGGAVYGPSCLAAAEGADGSYLVAQLPSDLTQLSLDDLLKIEVTSVSKRAEPLSRAAAAIYVLTGDDIRRAGVHSIAEALRMVPGLNVAQLNAQSYAISARGFNAYSADKLQVLLDGRSVYTPLFSGVFWDTLDTYLGDIDRIEVIRGPGAALWGANAVNGVINIITKDSGNTQGTAGRLSAGNVERVYGAARTGFAIGDGSARLYAQGTSRDNTKLPNGADSLDGQRLQQAGFRSEWSLPKEQKLTVSGDAYTGRESVAGRRDIGGTAENRVSGGNLLTRWSGRTSGGSGWALQAYYDGYSRNEQNVYAETRGTADIDFQQGFTLSGRHALVYGINYRATRDDTDGPPQAALIFSPSRRNLQNVSAFLQDQVALSADIELTLGSKFEFGTYVDFVAEPSVRIGWQPREHIFTWAAISRAVRTPNRFDHDVAVYCPPPNGYPGACGPGVFKIGNPDLGSTTLMAYEWGLRYSLWSNFSMDLATFYNDYSGIRSTEATPPFGSYSNNLDASSYGSELSLLWRPWEWATVRPSYQYLKIDSEPRSGSTDKKTGPALEGSSPRHQAGLRVSLQPWQRWQADADLRYVDKLPALGVPSYSELNLRIAYQLLPHLELALSGQNLLDSQHPEMSQGGTPYELRRGGMLEVSWGMR